MYALFAYPQGDPQDLQDLQGARTFSLSVEILSNGPPGRCEGPWRVQSLLWQPLVVETVGCYITLCKDVLRCQLLPVSISKFNLHPVKQPAPTHRLHNIVRKRRTILPSCHCGPGPGGPATALPCGQT